MSGLEETNRRLDRPVDDSRDHSLGPSDAPITLVEYGSYDCPICLSGRAQRQDREGEADGFGGSSVLPTAMAPRGTTASQ
jgi:hypothetical protein